MKYLIKLLSCLILVLSFNTEVSAFSCNNCGNNGSGGAPSGPAGGDLSGSYPNPTVISGTHLGNATVPNASLMITPLTTITGGATVSHEWVNGISAGGVVTLTQPNYLDLTGVLPNPSATSLGGTESVIPVTHQFLTGISTSGVPVQAQPAATDVSGLGSLAALGAGTGLGLSGGNLNISNTTVSAASYTNPNITVNAQGQITAASNGASIQGATNINITSDVTSITANTFTLIVAKTETTPTTGSTWLAHVCYQVNAQQTGTAATQSLNCYVTDGTINFANGVAAWPSTSTNNGGLSMCGISIAVNGSLTTYPNNTSETFTLKCASSGSNAWTAKATSGTTGGANTNMTLWFQQQS